MTDRLAIGVDIGGTFTDFVAVGEHVGLLTEKIPSTPADPASAVLSGLQRLLAGVDPATVRSFAHGTTVATNAMLERRGARVGLLTTGGFEDALEIGRLERSSIYELFLGPETPAFVAPRRVRIGIRERTGPDGDILTPLDEKAVAHAAVELTERHGVEAIAVCYLFSFRNPEHEQRTRDIIFGRYPKLPVSLSCEVDPRFREYERLCTTVFDAYLRPVVSGYLRRLESGVKATGIRSRVFIMQSSGGLYAADAAIGRPVAMLKSGLAAGVNGAAEVAKRAGYADVITVDIGGTSCDVALIRDGRPVVKDDNRIHTYPLRVPMVDVSTIGAGGGSIAWLDAAGGLHVGPRSAGADPGPVCYGRGGTAPTVTDASVVLGYLNPHYFAGGRLTLDDGAARDAIGALARSLGLSVPEAAYGIHRIINAAMANEVRKVSLGRGHDPRRFTLLALGGAGPVHACRLARDLGIRTVVIPELPGLLCAYGLLVSRVTHDQVDAYHLPARQVKPSSLTKRCREMGEAGRAVLSAEGATDRDVSVSYTAQARYVGQSYELDVAFGIDPESNVMERLVEAFHLRHELVYGRCNREREVEIVNVKVVHEWARPQSPVERPSCTRAGRAVPKGTRAVYVPECGGYEETAIYDRGSLPPGAALVGPAIIEQADTTTVIGPAERASVNQYGHLVIGLGA